ncbi:MAG: DUF1588 domain-containing protein [Planctomycetota bacterium]
MRVQNALVLLFLICLGLHDTARADQTLLEQYCSDCHSGSNVEGDFSLDAFGPSPTDANLREWLGALDRIKTGEMPPPEAGELDDAERTKLLGWLHHRLASFEPPPRKTLPPRRMNNREFANSIADVLLIEDAGTHLPNDDLIGDSLHHGFDTHGETLGFSKFHLEEYIRAIRKVVNSTILSGPKPESKRYDISPREILAASTNQNIKRAPRRGKATGFDFLDPRLLAYFESFSSAPASGWYRINIRCVALDRGRYDEEDTGIYDADPIRLKVVMGDRKETFDLPDDQVVTIELEEWLARETRFRMLHPTDGLRLLGNGNFKFQNRITAYYFKKYEPKRYAELVPTFQPAPNGRKRGPDDWHNWVDLWMGPRPRLLGATVEGPFFKSWPPERQIRLIGREPSIADTEAILKPIATRAWRRELRDGELDDIISLVQTRAPELGAIDALKEGIVALLVSPEFLLLGGEDLSPAERFASKFSTVLQSSIPSPELRAAVERGDLDSFEGVRRELQRSLNQNESDSFLQAFPTAWLELNDINFMSPDPDHFHHYHRKLVSEDMVQEALTFFEHAVKENLPLPELITADYSFINADLAKVYGVEGPQGSALEKHVFTDGRRGGFLGMGAFLTSTADSLSTSPIHRAICVMENFLGIHPVPPPSDVEITEPDVRQAKTIKEILEAHRSDSNCASCHRRIDPFGYAFENYGPDGSWRDRYTTIEDASNKRRRPKEQGIAIDSGATFLSGYAYKDIRGFREWMGTEMNQERFVRCFISKLLTYANGAEPRPSDFAEIDRIVSVSAEHDYRIVDTLAATIDSPLFREQ